MAYVLTQGKVKVIHYRVEPPGYATAEGKKRNCRVK